MKRTVRRILLPVSLAATMAVAAAAPAAAQGGPPPGTGNPGQGAFVFQCRDFGGQGVFVFTPSGNFHSNCRF